MRILLLSADRSTVLPLYIELIVSRTGECFFGLKTDHQKTVYCIEDTMQSLPSLQLSKISTSYQNLMK